MRLFVAFDVPREVENHLKELQRRILDKGAKVSLTKSFHLTLKFLGEVSPEKAESVKRALSSIHFSRFKTALDGTGVFPAFSRPRVLWVALKPEEPILSLQQKVEDSLSKIFQKEKRFVPHITLARVKKIENKEEFKKTIASLKPAELAFEVDKVVLYQSLPGPEGRDYVELFSISAA